MRGAKERSLRIAVVGGGPAGSFFALYALKYAHAVGRDISVTIYEAKDFRRFGQPGCNMCAGLIPVTVLYRFRELGLAIPPEVILGHINAYSLHTSAGVLNATQPDAHAEIVSVYRGAGPWHGRLLGQASFDALLLEEAVSRGARLRRSYVEAIRRDRPVEIVSGGETERFDLAVLASGLNGRPVSLPGFSYRPPPAGSMCQTELYLGEEEVQRRLGSSVHIFLPPEEIATYGILIPKGSFISASLLNARSQMRSMGQFLGLDEVKSVLGTQVRWSCGCLPKISVGLAQELVDDGFVAVGDAGATRLYKNGIGSALVTAERAARTAIYRGCTKDDFAVSYLPLCRAIDQDNRIGRLLFLQVPLLKRFGPIPIAHDRIASGANRHRAASELHTRILWGMFTGAYSYRQLFRMGMSPALLAQLALALGRAIH